MAWWCHIIPFVWRDTNWSHPSLLLTPYIQFLSKLVSSNFRLHPESDHFSSSLLQPFCPSHHYAPSELAYVYLLSTEKQNKIKSVTDLKEMLSVIETAFIYPLSFLIFFISNRTLILFKIITRSAKSLLLLPALAARYMQVQILSGASGNLLEED